MAVFISLPNNLLSFSSLRFSPSHRQVDKRATPTTSNKETTSIISFLPLKLDSSPKPLTVAMRQHQQQRQPQYVYPDPIPEFAQAGRPRRDPASEIYIQSLILHETQKFRSELLKQLSKDKHIFGNDMDKIVDVCAEIFSDFLHTEYGGPGTLLMEPFTDMLSSLKAKKLAGAPAAARAALLWAQNYVDHDWEIWNSQQSN